MCHKYLYINCMLLGPSRVSGQSQLSNLLYIYIFMYLFIYLFIYLSIHTYVWLHMQTHTHTHIHHIYIYIIYIYIYPYSNTTFIQSSVNKQHFLSLHGCIPNAAQSHGEVQLARAQGAEGGRVCGQDHRNGRSRGVAGGAEGAHLPHLDGSVPNWWRTSWRKAVGHGERSCLFWRKSHWNGWFRATLW